MKKQRYGFTLIELLVVIAIIAILAAILFPVFAQAKLAAKKTVDLSNVKELALAIYIYAGDNDDVTMHQDEQVDPPYLWWVGLLPYVKSKDVFRTPAYTKAPVTDITQGANYIDIYGHPCVQLVPCTYLPFSDYVINGLYVHGNNLTQVSTPSQQIIMSTRSAINGDIDYHPWPWDGQTWDDRSPLPVGAPNPTDPTLPDAHFSFYQDKDQTDPLADSSWFTYHIQERAWNNKGQNFGFVDGHAKYMTWEASLQGGQGLPGMHNIDRVAYIEGVQ